MSGTLLQPLLKRLLFFFVLLNVIIQVRSYAQIKFEGIPYIKNYAKQDYNSSPFNWNIIQDQRGIIYVANNYNLLEFDGNTWKCMPLPNRTVVRSLAIDKKGIVYVGGQADFGYLAPNEQGETSFISLKSKIDLTHRSFADVWKILVTEQGVMFCTFSGIYYLKNGDISFYKLDHNTFGITSFFYVHQQIFVCSEKQGIFELKNNSLVKMAGSEHVSAYLITGMLSSENKQVLLVTQKNGIYTLDEDKRIRPWIFNDYGFLKNNAITCATAISKGILLGSSHNGVLMIDKYGKPLLHLNEETGLQNNGIEYIYPDNNGNLWLALRDGVDYIEVNSPFTLFNSKSGIAGSGFTSWIDGKRLYLGTSEGLYYQDWKENEMLLSDRSFNLVSGSQGQTYNLQKLNNTLLLTHNNGAYEVHGNSLEKVGDQNGIWMFMPLLSHPDYIICGTYTGLYLYKMINNRLKYQWKIQGFDESSRVMEQDEEGNIWIAHGYLGLYKIRLSTDLHAIDKIEFYNSQHGFPSNAFINVYKINNELVFPGEKGIYSYHKESNSFVPHELFNSLISTTSHTRKLIEDKEGNIWFSVGDEIGIFKKRNGQNYEVSKTIFNKLQRKLVGGFEHIAYYDNKNVIIGIEDGFVHFDPSFVFNTDHTFLTLIRKAEVTRDSDSLLSAGWYSSSTTPWQQSSEKIPVLDYNHNALRFTYTSSSYEDAPKVQYQYRLEGYDKNWSTWTKATSKEYNNLREGTYTFYVKSKDIYNREGSVASYQFQILPPWYRTPLAYLVYSVLFFILLYTLKRIAQHEQKKAMQLKEIMHHEEVLKAEKEIIKLNNEKLETELAHKNKELASSAIHIVHGVETIQKIKTSLVTAIETVHDNEAKQHMKKLLRSISNEMTMETRWEQFEHHFNQIHQNFITRIRNEYPNLTHNDIKLIAYLKLNLSTKEIAPLLNLTVRGVEASRYRIRKKMNLNPAVNLTEFILKY
ncbi:ligand-binding sensor domain-containing protein [Chryseosolibacter indicus]|uniref:Two component regulator three Y domain-containing protein n=1 Tax=Chryseosolibacter indicus TaxID=2782351 RepID=A0ABS5VQY4_9BACT|nr:triple tyrosine motif-containing protein [Chryseosolibacter indicus]MBT1703761.1 hypothetical protein [Chryseosolibacter indicus]